MRGDAGLGQCVADELARALKLHGLGQLEGSGDSLGFHRGGSELVVERLRRIEARDWKREHHFIEIACTPLATGLQSCNALPRGLAA